MRIEEASCVFRGATFTGTFEVTGTGTNEAVQVHYKGQCLSATTCGLPVDRVASTLLQDLVAWNRSGPQSEAKRYDRRA